MVGMVGSELDPLINSEMDFFFRTQCVSLCRLTAARYVKKKKKKNGDLQKAGERRIGKPDESPRGMGVLNPIGIKFDGKNRGGDGTDPFDHGSPQNNDMNLLGTKKMTEKQNYSVNSLVLGDA